MKNLAIIVPCYNEEERLHTKEFIEFAQSNSQIYFVFVNDGSVDNTLSVLQNMQMQVPDKIFVHSLPKNSGKAEAVRSGINFILAEKKFDFVGFIDADLAVPLFEIKHLFDVFNTNEHIFLVAGSRVRMTGRIIERSLIRHYISRLFVTYYSNVLRIPNYDTQCGIKLFESRKAMQLFKDPFVSKWLFDIEIFIRAMKLVGSKKNYHSQIWEVPLHQWKEVGGSKLKISDFLKAPIEIYKIYKKYKIRD